jgi:hypothetical protein
MHQLLLSSDLQIAPKLTLLNIAGLLTSAQIIPEYQGRKALICVVPEFVTLSVQAACLSAVSASSHQGTESFPCHMSSLGKTETIPLIPRPTSLVSRPHVFCDSLPLIFTVPTTTDESTLILCADRKIC